MTNHNGVLMMQRLLLAGTLGLAVARKAAAILDGESASGDGNALTPDALTPDALTPDALTPDALTPDALTPDAPESAVLDGLRSPGLRSQDGAVLRAILDAANECLGHFDDRPPGERWCDALLHLLDLAAFAADLDSIINVDR
jgi:hypothetical protein